MLFLALSSTANAYMHLGQYDSDHLVEHHMTNAEHLDELDADHDHHCHIHAFGDLVEHDAIPVDSRRELIFTELSARPIFRNYIPLIPPPNL